MNRNLNRNSIQFHKIKKKKPNNHLSPQTIKHKKEHPYGIGNPDPGLGQAQKCGRVISMD